MNKQASQRKNRMSNKKGFSRKPSAQTKQANPRSGKATAKKQPTNADRRRQNTVSRKQSKATKPPVNRVDNNMNSRQRRD